MKRDVCSGHPHYSLSPGICYCPVSGEMYVSRETADLMGNGIPDFAKSVWIRSTLVDSFLDCFPAVARFAGVVLLQPDETVSGLQMDGPSMEELPAKYLRAP